MGTWRATSLTLAITSMALSGMMIGFGTPAPPDGRTALFGTHGEPPAVDPLGSVVAPPPPDQQTVVRHERALLMAGGPAGLHREAAVMGVANQRPHALTGVLVEMAWSSPTRGAGLARMCVAAHVDGEAVAQTCRADLRGILVLQVPSSAYPRGALAVSYWPVHDEPVPSAAYQLDVRVYTTMFRHSPPDPAFTAVPPF